MSLEITKDFRFEAAHHLPNLPPAHKCSRLHGHSFKAEITLKGEPNGTTGFILDFAILAAYAEPLIRQLDHNYLNAVEGLSVPTSENITLWLVERLKVTQIGEMLSRVVVHETCTCRAEWNA